MGIRCGGPWCLECGSQAGHRAVAGSAKNNAVHEGSPEQQGPHTGASVSKRSPFEASTWEQVRARGAQLKRAHGSKPGACQSRGLGEYGADLSSSHTWRTEFPSQQQAMVEEGSGIQAVQLFDRPSVDCWIGGLVEGV
mmetsp:Transcript_116088/g.266433  ORF Transcript_116088/g.266433 Transcript_116088/m.266433 type:complete len:138 (+) Transcript_116088:901-1314(+)